jgi:hypothetical protein
MTNPISAVIEFLGSLIDGPNPNPEVARAFVANPAQVASTAVGYPVSQAMLSNAATAVAAPSVAYGGDPVTNLQHAVADNHGFAFAPQRHTEAEVLSNNDVLSHNDTRLLSPETHIDKSVDLEFGDITFGDKTTNTATDGGVVVDGNNSGDILTDGSVKQEGDDNVANTGDIETGDGSPVVIGNDNDVENTNQQTGGGDIIQENEGPVVKTGDIDTSGGGASGGAGGGGILGGGDGGDATGGAGGGVVIAPTQTTTTNTGGGDITNVDTGGGDISGGVDASHDDNSSNSHNTDNSTHDSHDTIDNSVDNSIDQDVNQGGIDVF